MKMRLRKRFLLFPKTINGETRWMVNSFWMEHLCPMIQPFFGTAESPRWVAKRWVGDADDGGRNVFITGMFLLLILLFICNLAGAR